MKTCACIFPALLLGSALPVAASAESLGSAASATFFAGLELDNQESQRVDLGVALQSSRGTRFDLVGSRSESDAQALNVSSRYLFGQATHDFGRFGLGAGVRHMRDEDLSKTLGYLGSAFVDFAAVRITTSLETRNTDFDDTPFTTGGAELGLTGVTGASGVASCTVDSLGYSLGLSAVRPTFSFYASGTKFDYSSYDCNATVTSTTNGPATGPTAPASRAPVRVTLPAVVTRLNSNVTSNFAGYSSTRVPRNGALLESSVMIGTSFALNSSNTLGVELYQDSEEFSESDTTTALAYIAFPLTRSLGMEITAGASESDLLDSTVFAGVKLTADFGR